MFLKKCLMLIKAVSIYKKIYILFHEILLNVISNYFILLL